MRRWIDRAWDRKRRPARHPNLLPRSIPRRASSGRSAALSTPRVPSAMPRTVRTPVDAFIVARLLDSRALQLSPEADRHDAVAPR